MGEEFQDVLFYNKSFLSDISCDISKMSCLGAEIVFYVFSFFELFCLSSDRETAGAELGNMIWCGLAARTLEKLIIYYASPSLLRFLPTFRPIINWGLSANYEEVEHVWCAVHFQQVDVVKQQPQFKKTCQKFTAQNTTLYALRVDARFSSVLRQSSPSAN